MNKDKIYNPYSLPATFRAYVYDTIVLAWETKLMNNTFPIFNNKTLRSDCGLDVIMLASLDEIQLRDQDSWPTNEFLLFHKKGGGYARLFKSLRDTFAHGHYGVTEQSWVTIRHRYKSPKEKVEKTRVFGHLRIGTLKKLIAFLETTALP